MKKMTKIITLMLTLVLLFSLPVQGTNVNAATNKKANLTVSKNGKKFKITKGKKSYSFRYDWNSAKKRYTGYSSKKVNKIAPGTLYLGLHRDSTDHKDDSILVNEGVTINKKIYRGMTLSSFHKNIEKAWGKGYYGYWDNNENKAVKIGTRKPSDSLVKERVKDTGMYWVGKRGRLELSASITWNSKKKRAETEWTEIRVTTSK